MRKDFYFIDNAASLFIIFSASLNYLDTKKIAAMGNSLGTAASTSLTAVDTGCQNDRGNTSLVTHI